MKKTKLIGIVGIIFLAIIAVSLPVDAELTTSDAVLTATITRYEPLPAEPGNFVTVYIRLQNIGNKDASNTVLEIIPQFPFNIDASSARKNIGIIGSQRDYVADFRVRVDDNAISGVNKLKTRYTTNEKTGLWIEQELDIRVESVGSDIQITSVKTEPEELVPGQTGKLRIRIKNEAPTTMRDIRLSLNIDDTTTTTYPFIPLGTTTIQRIGSLTSGESSEFLYEIRPYPDAASQLYKVPITLTYTDNQQNEYTKSDLVGIIVNSKPELMVNIDEVRSDGSVVFKVTNKGLTNVKFLTLYLEESESYKVISPTNSYYIGELESDDYDTTDFQISCEKPDAEIVTKLVYRDANNNEYDEIKTLNAHNLVQCKTNGNGNTGTGTIIIIIVAVLIVGFIVYRIAKKKK